MAWVKEFLRNRRQRVKIESHFSDWTCVSSGIPQGSVLGPTLFICYINDLPDVITNCKVSMFADDTKIYLATKDATDIGLMQNDIDAISEWMRK